MKDYLILLAFTECPSIQAIRTEKTGHHVEKSREQFALEKEIYSTYSLNHTCELMFFFTKFLTHKSEMKCFIAIDLLRLFEFRGTQNYCCFSHCCSKNT